ncbi:ABC transporter substrate-binding protein [Catenuloplanes japonicus]|uniref:ABC transporter substrate-binding protein n=1 Tax=Catenuloplanes japonicus TaxID=33876 RepID=UPI00052516F8|nr:ABC transporter substrate-binding protein [Catenuloplanes japonicus]
MSNGISRRNVLSIAAGVGAASALAACGGSGGDAAAAVNTETPVTLRFTWWGSDARHKRTAQVIELFKSKYPNFTINGEFKDWNGYWDSLATTVAANDAPDIIQMDEMYLASYAERGALLDLGTASNHLKTADIESTALDTGKVDGKQYAIPTGLTAYSFVVNEDLIKQYNVTLPDTETWSWEDLRAVGDQISKASGGKVIGVQSWGFDTGSVNVWLRQQGASLYSPDGKVAAPPALLAGYWQYLLDLAKAGVSPQPSITIERAAAALDQSGMATNTTAIGTAWNTQLTSYQAASGQNLRLIKIPGESKVGTPGAYYKPSMYWSISSRSKHPAEAAVFVDFLLNSQEAGDVLLTDRGVPGNKTIRAALAPKLTATDKAAADYLDAIKVGPAPRVTPNGASGIEAILKRHSEEVLFERKTPQAAAESFIKELQTEIDAA